MANTPAKPLHIFCILCKKRLVKGRVLSTFLLLFLNAVSMLCSALFKKTGFLSQNAAAKASIQRLHILTSKGCKMAAVSMKHWNDLTWHDSTRISWNKFLEVFRSLIINLIPAWDSDNFVLGIWNLYERCNSVEKLVISTDACVSCLLLLCTKIFLSFRLNNVVSYNSGLSV